MAELPTPHSIAIGTLISLYSDPHSPIYAESLSVGGGGRSRGGNKQLQQQQQQWLGPHNSAEWSLRLMTLIQQLVLKEDEGVVIIPNNRTGNQSSSINYSNPAADDDDDDDENSHNNNMLPAALAPVAETRNKDQSNPNDTSNIILDDDEYFMKKHAALLSSTGEDMSEIFNDMFLVGGGNDVIFGDGSCSSAEPNSSSSYTDRQTSNIGGGGALFQFCMESFSTLLDRIDDAFTLNAPQLSNFKMKKERSPPSQVLLSQLSNASQSVDHLMDLLDTWHALLEGTHFPNVNANPPIKIDGESSFGIYIRKLCLGIEEIPFEALSRLWIALKEFVKKEEMESSIRDGDDEEMKCCDNEYTDDDGKYYSTMAAHWLPSSAQIERIVRNTCLRYNLDSMVLQEDNINNVSSNGGNLPISSSSPSSLSISQKKKHNHHQQQQQLYNLLSTHPECPSLHFLLYLTSLANGQRSQAIESLHRYFDYAMIHERKERAERALMVALSGGSSGQTSGSAGAGTMNNMSGMGGITGGMTGGIINGTVQTGGGGQQQQRSGAGNAGTATQTIFKESNVMQYAAILLAQTYHRFGYTRLALQATEEAIRVAQQSGDGECVLFANGWLALVSSSLGSSNSFTSSGGDDGNRGSVYASIGGLDYSSLGGTTYRPLDPSSQIPSVGGNILNSRREEEAMLHRCQARAAERGLSSLAVGTSLELARKLAYQRQGRSTATSHGGSEGGDGEEGISSLAWNSIQSAGRAPVVSTTAGGHRVTSMSGGGPKGEAPTDIYNSIPRESISVLGRQNCAIAGLWESTGHMSLASLSSCAALYGSGKEGVEGGCNNGMDSIAMNRVLNSFTNGAGLDVWSNEDQLDPSEVKKNPQNGETYAAMLNHLISLPANISERTLIAASTLHEWSVRSYDLSLAQGLNTLLANHASFFTSPSEVVSGGALPAVEANLVFLAQSTHLFCQRKEYDLAKVATRRACWVANRHGLCFHLGWSLLQLSLITLEASASCSPERALPPLLECLDLAERYSLDPLRAMALSTLAKVLLCMGGKRNGKARALLKAAMPLIMQHGHVWFQGEACLTLAKCYIIEAGAESNDPTTTTPPKLQETALTKLKQAAVYFERIEDVHRLRQVYYLKARIYQMLPNKKGERDESAKMFARLTVAMNKRVGESVLATVSNNQQWKVLRGVLVTDNLDLQRCISIKQNFISRIVI